MKSPMINSLVLLLFMPVGSSAQNCKPDISQLDKISKQQVEVWQQTLWSTGFLSSVANSDESEIIATVGRYGSTNAVNIVIHRREDPKRGKNEAFDLAYRGAVGQPYYLGFKDGDPLKFIVTQVSNPTGVKEGVFNNSTTVILSAVITNDALARMRSTLTTRQVDAVRVVLAESAQLEKAVSNGNGTKMMAKFSCLFQALDKHGVDLLATAGEIDRTQPDVPIASAVGKYVRKNKASDFIQLEPDGGFALRQDGQSAEGRYRMVNNELILQLRGREIGGSRMVSDTIFDNEGMVWIRSTPSTNTKQNSVSQSGSGSITVDQIIQMTSAKVSDDIIILTIQKAGSKFDLTPDLWS